jgi:hypothetical protein
MARPSHPPQLDYFFILISQGNGGKSYIDACLKYMLNINKGVICKDFKPNSVNTFVSRCLVLCMILDNPACGTTASEVS